MSPARQREISARQAAGVVRLPFDFLIMGLFIALSTPPPSPPQRVTNSLPLVCSLTATPFQAETTIRNANGTWQLSKAMQADMVRLIELGAKHREAQVTLQAKKHPPKPTPPLTGESEEAQIRNKIKFLQKQAARGHIVHMDAEMWSRMVEQLPQHLLNTEVPEDPLDEPKLRKALRLTFEGLEEEVGSGAPPPPPSRNTASFCAHWTTAHWVMPLSSCSHNVVAQRHIAPVGVRPIRAYAARFDGELPHRSNRATWAARRNGLFYQMEGQLQKQPSCAGPAAAAPAALHPGDACRLAEPQTPVSAAAIETEHRPNYIQSSRRITIKLCTNVSCTRHATMPPCT